MIPKDLNVLSFVDRRIVLLSGGRQLLRSVASRAKSVEPKGRLVRKK